MDCPDKSRIALFVQGELPGEDVSRLEAHLDVCESCLARIAEIASSTARSRGEEEKWTPDDSVFVHLVAALARRSDGISVVSPVLRDRIGPYRVLGVLGRGAMGIVYRAIHEGSQQKAAIKTVAGTNPRLLAAMRREIAFLEQHRHEGVVQIFENGVIDGDPWYAMELLEGSTLEAYNERSWGRSRRSSPPSGAAPTLGPAGGVASLDQIMTLYARLCGPLAFVHRTGVVHCDLKPANVFLRRDDQPVIMDFGLLSRAGGAIGRESLEVGGKLRGTLPYISPELIRGKIPDARADLYTLGCMLYESVTGRPPFLAVTANGLVEAHLRTEPQPASELVSGVPRRLDELLARLLAKRADQRIGDADVVADILTQVGCAPDSPRRTPARSVPYLFRPRLVGREDVLEQVEVLRADAENGHGHLVLLGGESGIGKTFLASEIAQRAARAGFEVVTGECTPVAPTQGGSQEVVGAALEPFRKLLQHASDRCRHLPRDTATQLFGSELSIRLLARYEPSLRQWLDTPSGDELPALPPTAERERILQALSDLLDRLSDDAPLLLVVDDLQWADDLSLALVDFLSGRDLVGRRMLVLALYRSDEIPKPIVDLQKKSTVRAVHLGRLDPSALSVLVGDLLSDRPPPNFVEALALHSEGNPFFVAEYLRAGAAEGLLERTPSGWRFVQSATGYGGLALPPSLLALLERRIASLPPAAQRIAEAAAVLGREIPIRMLATVSGVPVDDLQPMIDELVTRQVVDRSSTDALRFFHDKIREAAYARLDGVSRSSLHRAAAHTIETTFTTLPERQPHYAALAYHLRLAGQASRAIDYLEKAGQLALQRSANADAARLFVEACDLSVQEAIPVPASRRALWERRIGDALQGLGSLSESKEHLLRAVRLLGQPAPQTTWGVASGIARKLAREIVKRTTPASWHRTDSGDDASLETARAYDRLMQVYWYRGELGPLLFANMSVLDFAQRAPASPILAVAYANAGATAGIIPLRQTAELYFRLAQATLKDAYDPEVESYFHTLYSNYLNGIADWRRAADGADRILRLADQLAFGRRWEEGAGIRSNLAWDRDLSECLRWSDRMFQSALRRSDRQMISWGYLRAAEVHAARGILDQAEASLADAERFVFDLGLPEQTRALALRAFVQNARGQVADALATAERASKLVAQAKTVYSYCVDSYGRVAEVCISASARAGRIDPHLKAQARDACRNLARAARIFPIAQPRYCRAEGQRQWQRGRRRAALGLWRRGLRTAIRLGIPLEEALLTLTLLKHVHRDEPSLSKVHALDILQRLEVRSPAVAE